MACYDLCRPCGPTPLANSCNEPCALQCQDSRVIIDPSPVLVTLPGPIMTSFPQSTAVGSTSSAAAGLHFAAVSTAQASKPIAKSTAIAQPIAKATKSPRDGLSLHTEFSAHGSRGGGSDGGALGEGEPISGGFGGFGYGLGYGRGFGYGLGCGYGLGGLGCYGRRGGYNC
ncbi:PREDICTED: claw keratin-like [Ficedula albicollis]|uniref:claw keratin-like n=1 Tax=Ficedula albicollis TaxID=59894 RepID=UPI0007AD879A|nr:PREDICTED: claw keratin-like [Ficedula albicollis]